MYPSKQQLTSSPLTPPPPALSQWSVRTSSLKPKRNSGWSTLANSSSIERQGRDLLPHPIHFVNLKDGALEKKATPSTIRSPLGAPTKDFGFLPIPKRLQHHPNEAFNFTKTLNILFALAATLLIGNLNYSQPLLIQLADEFNVSQGVIASIPTLTQIGYALGVLLISPLGDLVRRRQLLLLVVVLSTFITVLMALAPNVLLFQVLSFFLGLSTVAPQVLIPLAADLAPPERRQTAVSIVLSALFAGIVVSRVLAGTIGSFASFRAVYWMASGLQVLVLVGVYFVIPDFPKKDTGVTYWGILASMAKLAVTEPLLIQCCLVKMCSSIQFSGFWITLTFLLGGPIYKFSTCVASLIFRLTIGLFGLVGLVGIALGPLLARLVKKLVPWYAGLFALFGMMITHGIYIGTATLSVAAVVAVCIALGAFIDLEQIALSGRVFDINAQARARLNAVFIVSISVGQAIGTAASSSIFLAHGTRGVGFFWFDLCALQVLLLVVRGPHTALKRWFGWEGGASLLRKEVSVEDEGLEDARKDVLRGEKSRLPDLRP
ncbi:major facilitator superfamily domain-containing protein [Pterulicium gracile]|uniref:Major facilitator superfamily domain-containing protein n=1 Tax=Pterulicium gracile TaxID=1884261 RepID=A0A5C3Q3B6_9AGAR|nr:major facilitator superfamily domain-containing protein [Pterula gracilis]